MVQTYSGFHWTSTNPEVPLSPTAVNRLAELALPMMVIVGQKDIEDVQVQTNLLTLQVRGIQQRVIAGAGHMSNMEAPAALNAVLLDFLS